MKIRNGEHFFDVSTSPPVLRAEATARMVSKDKNNLFTDSVFNALAFVCFFRKTVTVSQSESAIVQGF
jgi:hypothetical protein